MNDDPRFWGWTVAAVALAILGTARTLYGIGPEPLFQAGLDYAFAVVAAHRADRIRHPDKDKTP